MSNPVNVVFTGPATYQGMPIVRADLISYVAQNGYRVQSSVRPTTDMLVASRCETVKARAAYERGITVLTYGDFLDRLGGAPTPSGAPANAYTDAQTTGVASGWVPTKGQLALAALQPADWL